MYLGFEKQATVALLTSAAEYHAIVTAAKDLVWMNRLIIESGWTVRYILDLLSDNQSAISWIDGE